ncbi:MULTISPECIES: transglutaminase-like domain-containing protein [Subtercola]|uniref:Transglutaminase family protein n=1 Tax=Subtercola vilae TaxID=2056433 RepID=A0A4T2BXH4_9MICO|nr:MULTISPECIES: transglutaminase family protein [Subtercola]MEA9985205.1 transglutaminase family protein [Subtercola sp. RTI3]TIH34546.1 transglutaminase family protein [Subtercola vilae]
MKRTVSAHIECDIDAPANLVFSIAVAAGLATQKESIEYLYNGHPITPVEILDVHGTRLHEFDAGAGHLSLNYWAEVDGLETAVPVTKNDLITYLRPSRYCESDMLLPTARSEFRGLEGRILLDCVSSWVGEKLSYVPGSSLPTDGAVRTLLSRQGVCRDYAHLVITLLRGLDVPARLVSVYAPGLRPMDFHAVAEAYIDGEWFIVDATALAPRQSLVRIATGRDAADTAFLTNHGGWLTLTALEVTATADALPHDDTRELVQLH